MKGRQLFFRLKAAATLKLRSPRTVEELEKLLAAPLMGILPPESVLLPRGVADETATRAYRILAENVLAAATATQRRTVGIVPASEGDRESLIALNAAFILCSQGRRVLLIDCTSHPSMLNSLLGLNPKPNLADFALPHLTLDAFIKRCAVPGLEIITQRPGLADPAREAVFRWLRHSLDSLASPYDLVVVACPALQPRRDLRTFLNLLGAYICIVRYDRGGIADGIRFVCRARDCGFTPVGAVLDDVALPETNTAPSPVRL